MNTMAEDNPWNESLFGCCDDLGICCYGFWCPSCLFGSNAQKLDESDCCIMCCIHCMLTNLYQSWLLQYFKRGKLRQLYGLKEESTCGDVPATFCCSTCALCQEAREMKSRDHRPGMTHSVDYQIRTYPVIAQPTFTKQKSHDAYEARAF